MVQSTPWARLYSVPMDVLVQSTDHIVGYGVYYENWYE